MYFEAERREQGDLIHPLSITDDEQGSITVNQVWAAQNAKGEVIEGDIDDIEAMLFGITDGEETLQNADTALVEVKPDELGGDFAAEVLTATDDERDITTRFDREPGLDNIANLRLNVSSETSNWL